MTPELAGGSACPTFPIGTQFVSEVGRRFRLLTVQPSIVLIGGVARGRIGRLSTGGFVVPGFRGRGFVAVFYAVVQMQIGRGSQALVVQAG
jgi:hypothetical protein